MEIKEQLVRQVTPTGNGAHIFAPKEWLGEEVILIRKPKQNTKEKILSLLEPHLEDIMGAYLYGSRARGEEEFDSDIDLLVITTKKIKIKGKGFEIISLTESEIEKALNSEPLIMHSIFVEAKPIINSHLLSILKEKYKPKLKDFKEFLASTKRIIKINKTFLGLCEEKVYGNPESASYSLILRIRGIHIVNQLLANKIYSHRAFKTWIKTKLPGINLTNIYNAYRAIKYNSKIPKVVIKDLFSLLELLENETRDLEYQIHGKKRKKIAKKH